MSDIDRTRGALRAVEVAIDEIVVFVSSSESRAGLRVGAGVRTGAVALAQRFGSALNLNPHRLSSASDQQFSRPSVHHHDRLSTRAGDPRSAASSR